jgi:hypothetical protein
MKIVKNIAANTFAFVVMLNVVSFGMMVVTMGFAPIPLIVVAAYMAAGIIHYKWTRFVIRKVLS